MAVNYFEIQEALRDVLASGTYTSDPLPLKFLIEAMDREINLAELPLMNIRLTEADYEVRSMPDGYYVHLTFEIDVITYDLSYFKNAATVRDTILKEAQDIIRANKNFHADIETSRIAPQVRFSAGAPEGSNGHIASTTFSVDVEINVD